MTDFTGNDENATIGETDVPEGNWEEAVEFYAQAIGAALPSNLAVSPLVLQGNDLTLQLNKVADDKEGTTLAPKRYTRLKGPRPFELVTRYYQAFLEGDPTAFSLLEPHYVPGPGTQTIIMALVGYGDPCLDKKLLSRVDGIIHNPNW